MHTPSPNFQRQLWQIDHLPYKDEIIQNSEENFKKITNGLLESIAKKDLYDGLSFYLVQLQRYIQLYEIQMTKDDHKMILRILYTLMMERKLHVDIFNGVTYLIYIILPSVSKLTRDDVDFINWKELYEFYKYVSNEKDREGRFYLTLKSLTQLQKTIVRLRYLFPLSATKEIINEIRTIFYPFDSTMDSAMKLLSLFLPLRMTYEEHTNYGASLWFEEIWKWYTLADHNLPWDPLCVEMFSGLAKYCCGFGNWSDKYDIILSKSLRNFDISFGNNREISLTDDNSNTSQKLLATWFVYMLGGKDDGFQLHLTKFFTSIESYFHPSNDGDHIESLIRFVNNLTTEMGTRIHYERYSTKKVNTTSEMRLTDIQIEKFVRTLMQVMKWLVFSKCELESIPETIKKLCDISPGIVLPFVLKLIYPALRNVSAPHRLRQSMKCFLSICLSLVRDYDCNILRDNCDEEVLKSIELIYLEKENFQDIKKMNEKGLSKKDEKILRKKIKLRKLTMDELINGNSEILKKSNSFGKDTNLLKIEMEADGDLNNVRIDCQLTEKTSNTSSKNLYSKILQHDFSGPLRFHIILLLEMIIKSFDINDIEKTSLSLEALTRIFNVIIVADCSEAVNQMKNELNKEEIRLCQLTKEFPNIIELFLTNVFSLIDKLEAGGARIRNDDADCGKVSGLSECEENDKEALLSNEEITLRENLVFVFTGLLENCSSLIRQTIFNSILKYVKENVFENQLSISIITGVINQIIYFDPEYSFPLLYNHVKQNFPGCYPKVNENIEIDIALMWYISLSCCIFSLPGLSILKYKKEVSELAEFLLNFDHKMVYHLGCNGLLNTFTNLIGTYTEVNTKLIAKVDKPFNEFLPIRYWGKTCDKRNPTTKIIFHTSTKDEVDFAFKLSSCILNSSLKKFETIKNLSKKQIRKHLEIIKMVLRGMSEVLRPLDGNFISLYKIYNNKNSDLYFNNITKKTETNNYLIGKPNFRNIICKTLTNILPYMLANREAETTNINMILSIYNKILFDYGITQSSYNDEQSDAINNEMIFGNIVLGAKADIFDVVRKKVSLCHNTRLLLFLTEPCIFNDTYLQILNDYILAAESSYSKISNLAIGYIDDLLSTFPRALKYILPHVEQLLSLTGEKNEYKISAGYKLISLDLCSGTRDYKIKNEIIKAISQNSNHFQYQIVVKCIKENCIPALSKWKQSPIDLTISQNLHSYSIKQYLFKNSKNLDTSECDKFEDTKNKETLKEYMEIVETIVSTLSNPDSHWQVKKILLELMLNFITHHLKAKHSECIIKFLIDSDIDNAKNVLSFIFDYMIYTKPPVIKISIKPPISNFNRNFDNNGIPLYGIFEDNLCMTYDSYLDQKTLKQISKNYIGFNKWPKMIKASSPCDDQHLCNRSYTQLDDVEKSIVNFFKQYSNVEKFFENIALSYTEKSGFYLRLASFISQLGRNYNDAALMNFLKIMEKYACHEKLAEKKIAAVIFAGLGRGTKYWNMEKYDNFINLMKEKMPKIWDSLTPEIFNHWGEAISLVLAKRDVRRYKWLVDLILQFSSQIHSTMHPILIQIRLSLLGMINCSFSWRGTSIMTRCTEIALKHLLSSHYVVMKSAADIISDACLLDIHGFAFDDRIPLSMKPYDMDIIFERLGESLNVMMSEGYTKCFFSGNELVPIDKQSKIYKTSFNALQSIILIIENRFVTGFLRFTSYIFILIPIIATFENDINDNMRKACSLALNEIIPKLILKKSMVLEFIETMEHALKYSRSWKTQCSILRITRTIIFGSYFNALSEEHKQRIENMIIEMIASSFIEVRQSAAESLTGLILCNYLTVNSRILNIFLKMARDSNGNEHKKHGGILGLGAIVLGFPYTCPHYIPKVIVALAKIARKSNNKILHNSMITTLGDFKRTHQDTWDEHEKCFKTEQLAILNNVLTSPNYYI
ncbi:Proteasome activator complex subunit 4B [Strongyloides ratti]|uniref:Proteasome activator complex subunit 4B n=1 Tax=Strongyloides ratti TaxID=34506 RepID=A0A090MW35_STRRB|nr:Proteasome activator complex subunit 4B [Strongyloides ratti]CEF63373.1 Proteasome activator complex subunit 4B [Strongyloides ratti]